LTDPIHMFDLFSDILFRLPVETHFTYKIPEDLKNTIKPGMRVKVNFNGKEEEGMAVRIHSVVPDFKTKEILKQIDPKPIVNEYQIRMAYWMSERYLAGPGECIFKMFPPGKRITKNQPEVPSETDLPRFHLNDEQKAVYDSVIEKIQNKHSTECRLVHGITGSGKTEVYIHLIHEVLKMNRQALLLVPEISLTIQLIQRLQEVFKNNLALMHSGMKGADRFRSYHSVLSGEKKIVVGTRSAVFAPLTDPGIIVIDEEHDSSFREHSSPRYDARTVARKIAADHHSILLLGSATPRIETYFNAVKEKNTIFYSRLKTRATGADLPEVEIIKIEDFNSPISGDALQKINQNIKNKEQSIILLNRRGYSPFQYCRKCESSLSCPSCSVGLNYHKNGKLICHYCGYTRPNTGVCDKCGSKTEMAGSGTQKVEDYLLSLYPEIRLERLDTDAALDSSSVGECIERLLGGEIDLLLGTQMIAKGLDAPNVTLVGVLQADYGLNLPDFRAQERTFSLLTQVAGRSGRGEKKGKVFFEALNPENSVLIHAANQDYSAFYNEEIRYRYDAWYPPFCKIVRILFRSEDEESAKLESEKFSNQINERMVRQSENEKVHTMILGPAPAPIARMHNKFRFHVLIKTVRPETLHGLLKETVSEFKKSMGKTVYMEIEFDAMDLL